MNIARELNYDAMIIASENGALREVSSLIVAADKETILDSIRAAGTQLYVAYKNNDHDTQVNLKKVIRMLSDVMGPFDIATQLTESISGPEGKALTAATNGDLDTLIRLVQDGHQFSSDIFDTAADSGHLNIVKWLHKNGISGSTDALRESAYFGQSHMVSYLIDIERPSTELLKEVIEMDRYPITNQHDAKHAQILVILLDALDN